MKSTLSHLRGKELPPFTGLLLLAAHLTAAAEDPSPSSDDNPHKQPSSPLSSIRPWKRHLKALKTTRA